ncbi:MAG: sarcosine oxidase subunit alpha family protein [Kiloniellaceae bacterium]|nr:sarcosine oxidase subunit alpha family protein [Kiloniellaceae bacterium]
MRLPQGGFVAHDELLTFTFNGKTYKGLAGDTLASALLANGIHMVGRSFKYHRPRGIVSAGGEEPNALMQVGDDPRSEPNLKATQVELVDGLKAKSQNAWPSLEFDVGALNGLASRFLPAGFYYKTFMWPASAWMTYEHFIRRAAGLGVSPRQRDPDRYDKTFAHCDVLVVGGGPAGLAAALSAGRAGARVILAEQDHLLGGALLNTQGEVIDGQPARDWIAAAEAELAALPEVRVLKRTICYAAFDHNFFGLVESVTDHLPRPPENLPRKRLWKLRTKQVVYCAGAIERPLVFADNDRPGVMTASAVQSYVNRYALRPGRRAVVFTNNDSGYGAALDMKAAGIEVAAVVDARQVPAGPLTERATALGLRILGGFAIVAVEGARRVKRVRVAELSLDGKTVTGVPEAIDCDLVASSGGWNPTVHLFCQAKGKLRWDDEHACFLPDAAMQTGQQSAGAANGRFGLGSCLREGTEAGAAAAAACGFAPSDTAASQAEDRDFLPGRWIWLVPGEHPLGHKAKHFVDQQNDVTAADLKLALREGYRSIEHVKRYTTTGMATDQGKMGNVNAIGIVADEVGGHLPEVGVTTFRPPYTPVTFGVFAGRDVDNLLDPVRRTPMHAWHERNGALFEDVGQWRRAWYYPQHGEDMHAAVNREVKAVRDSLGILDATTLGKIDIQGPDAAEFLNRVYTNAWLKLGIGRCRYGLMLKEDGMVMDDGVTTRLGEKHYLMTTTTGNAAAVLGHLEDYLQTEWPDLQVYLTSVTEQFATMTLSGPSARRLLADVSDADLSPEALPHMAYTAAKVAGVPARIFRISFTGELSYEINVPASFGMAVWQTLTTAGERYGITPYGTEAMHVLRAEKGYIIVGQETDGSVTPHDLGMDWAVSKTKDFVGRRSLSREDMARPDRKQLVGLLTKDPKEVLPEGAQLVEKVLPQPPMPMLGHVTSSYHSPNCGRSIAMALVKGGLARKGETLFAPLGDGRTIACVVADTCVFFDPEGERLK